MSAEGYFQQRFNHQYRGALPSGAEYQKEFNAWINSYFWYSSTAFNEEFTIRDGDHITFKSEIPGVTMEMMKLSGLWQNILREHEPSHGQVILADRPIRPKVGHWIATIYQEGTWYMVRAYSRLDPKWTDLRLYPETIPEIIPQRSSFSESFYNPIQ